MSALPIPARQRTASGWRGLGLACGLALLALGWPAPARADATEVSVARRGCVPEGWHDEAFAGALRAELAALGVRVVDGTRSGSIVVELRCEGGSGPSAWLEVRLPGPRAAARLVSFADLDPALRERTVALAAHELVAGALAGDVATPTAAPAPPPDGLRPGLEIGARLLVLPEGPLLAAGTLLGGLLGNTGSPFEGALEIAFAYAERSSAMGVVRGTSTDLRIAGRLSLDLPPVRLGVELGLVGSHLWIGGQGTTTRAAELHALGLAIDAQLRAEMSLADAVAIALAGGVRGYLVGAEGRLAGSPGVAFVEALPLLSLSLTVRP